MNSVLPFKEQDISQLGSKLETINTCSGCFNRFSGQTRSISATLKTEFEDQNCKLLLIVSFCIPVLHRVAAQKIFIPANNKESIN